MDELADIYQQDAAAVAAVCGGDVHRYRELVERHERQVFAVAWSRLGNMALAEEAAQETFIRGYQRLQQLANGAKFAGWITPLARNIAINVALKNRRELHKHERWAMEQVEAEPAEIEESEEICTPETLRATLAGMPAAHRECLVDAMFDKAMAAGLKGIKEGGIAGVRLPDGYRFVWFGLAACIGVETVIAFRNLRNGPNRFHALVFVTNVISLIALLSMAMDWLPFLVGCVAISGAYLFQTYVSGVAH